MAATRKPAVKPAPELMIATTTYFGPDNLYVPEGTIVAADHPEPAARPDNWKPVQPAP